MGLTFYIVYKVALWGGESWVVLKVLVIYYSLTILSKSLGLTWNFLPLLLNSYSSILNYGAPSSPKLTSGGSFIKDKIFPPDFYKLTTNEFSIWFEGFNTMLF